MFKSLARAAVQGRVNLTARSVFSHQVANQGRVAEAAGRYYVTEGEAQPEAEAAKPAETSAAPAATAATPAATAPAATSQPGFRPFQPAAGTQTAAAAAAAAATPSSTAGTNAADKPLPVRRPRPPRPAAAAPAPAASAPAASDAKPSTETPTPKAQQTPKAPATQKVTTEIRPNPFFPPPRADLLHPRFTFFLAIKGKAGSAIRFMTTPTGVRVDLHNQIGEEGSSSREVFASEPAFGLTLSIQDMARAIAVLEGDQGTCTVSSSKGYVFKLSKDGNLSIKVSASATTPDFALDSADKVLLREFLLAAVRRRMGF